MLVLSRRVKEKVLFPTLGISVEVISLSSKKTQLGISAPREIRVIREELHDFEINTDAVANFSAEEIQEDLDIASMAIHLAQNQLRQGLDENAEDALDRALASLKVIEEKLSFNAENPTCLARESKSTYSIHRSTRSDWWPKVEDWRNRLLSY